MHYFHLTKRSSNQKTGPMAVTTTSISTCPDTCAFKKSGCYAASSFLGMFWKKLSDGQYAITWEQLLEELKSLKGSIRLNQAGDLISTKNGKIDRNKLRSLIAASKHLDKICYTHHNDIETIKWANDRGFPLIHSANTIQDIDIMVPNSVVVSHENERGSDESLTDWRNRTRPMIDTLKDLTGATRAFICPAQYMESVNCASCMACSNMKCGDVVAFIAHSNKKKQIQTQL